ncbi:MAG TPA: hypothetical protein VK175_03950 [Leadbetterella sp.]|nr:hypothetical protein [Leadbetterella sp.]
MKSSLIKDNQKYKPRKLNRKSVVRKVEGEPLLFHRMAAQPFPTLCKPISIGFSMIVIVILPKDISLDYLLNFLG